MAQTKQYRVQRADFHGFAARGWGFGNVASWGPWRTVAAHATQEAAEAAWTVLVGTRGLSRMRLVHGAQVLRKTD